LREVESLWEGLERDEQVEHSVVVQQLQLIVFLADDSQRSSNLVHLPKPLQSNPPPIIGGATSHFPQTLPSQPKQRVNLQFIGLTKIPNVNTNKLSPKVTSTFIVSHENFKLSQFVDLVRYIN
jgi:hypothetical protein